MKVDVIRKQVTSEKIMNAAMELFAKKDMTV